MKVSYQADADFNEDIVSGVLRRVPEIDFQTAYEAALESLTDLEVLALAAQEGRILVTHDRRTMPAHFGQFIKNNQSPGLLIVSQKAVLLSVIEDLILIWTASEAEEYVNSIRTLPF
jgi:predicted nuclease of predicted toxin-antitoxin system